MIRSEIFQLIKDAIAKAQQDKELPAFALPKITIEHPENSQFGDYSCNVAMQLAKPVQKNPLEIAEIIKVACEKLDTKDSPFAKIEVAKPGFINFYLSEEYLQNQVIRRILNDRDKYGDSDIGKGKKIHLDFVSANPTGPLHIGNSRGGVMGDVLANVLEKTGCTVWREYIVNNVGNQITVLGHSVLKDEEAEYKGDYIDNLHQKIKGDNPNKVGQQAADMIITTIIEPTLQRLGIKFDEYYSERSLHESGKVEKVFNEFKEKDLLYEKDGALWFRATKYGDDKDRVVKKSNGMVTYFGADIAYHQEKFSRGYDHLINIWGADHHGDVKRVMGAVEALGHKGQLEIILTQMVRVIKDGKELRMSKRKGTAITIDDLIDEVGKDAVRFFFLMYSVDRHMNFDLDLAKEESSKNPVYYVQYAHARIASILNKEDGKNIEDGGVKNSDGSTSFPAADYGLLIHKKELDLVRELNKWPELVADIARNYEVHRLPYYAMELAGRFHSFYRECKVLGEDKDLMLARVMLIIATKKVLKNVLDVIGVGAPEKM
ncbi:arginine--tRNA ligase [Patescibacteria group bacterium]|nr:arginine--tRNA ligase [Patescibacteria group bacterium]